MSKGMEEELQSIAKELNKELQKRGLQIASINLEGNGVIYGEVYEIGRRHFGLLPFTFRLETLLRGAEDIAKYINFHTMFSRSHTFEDYE